MYTEYYIMKSLSSDNQSLFAFIYSFQNLSKCCLKEKSLLFDRFKKFSDTWELEAKNWQTNKQIIMRLEWVMSLNRLLFFCVKCFCFSSVE